MKSHKKGIKLVSPSKGHKPKGAHGVAAVKALGRTKTTGNFARIEKARGKGAAIAAYQNALHAHKGKKKAHAKLKFGSAEWRAKYMGKKKSHKKMTEAEDRAYDRKHGIKEGSKRDIAEDKKHGVKDKKHK